MNDDPGDSSKSTDRLRRRGAESRPAPGRRPTSERTYQPEGGDEPLGLPWRQPDQAPPHRRRFLGRDLGLSTRWVEAYAIPRQPVSGEAGANQSSGTTSSNCRPWSSLAPAVRHSQGRGGFLKHVGVRAACAAGTDLCGRGRRSGVSRRRKAEADGPGGANGGSRSSAPRQEVSPGSTPCSPVYPDKTAARPARHGAGSPPSCPRRGS